MKISLEIEVNEKSLSNLKAFAELLENLFELNAKIEIADIEIDKAFSMLESEIIEKYSQIDVNANFKQIFNFLYNISLLDLQEDFFSICKRMRELHHIEHLAIDLSFSQRKIEIEQ
jgi:hypothetical protein